MQIRPIKTQAIIPNDASRIEERLEELSDKARRLKERFYTSGPKPLKKSEFYAQMHILGVGFTQIFLGGQLKTRAIHMSSFLEFGKLDPSKWKEDFGYYSKFYQSLLSVSLHIMDSLYPAPAFMLATLGLKHKEDYRGWLHTDVAVAVQRGIAHWASWSVVRSPVRGD